MLGEPHSFTNGFGFARLSLEGREGSGGCAQLYGGKIERIEGRKGGTLKMANITLQKVPPPSGTGTPKPWILQRLPVFPAVASRLVTMVSREDASFRQVADLIGKDTGLTADLIRLANSPLIGCRFEIRSVLHAISVLGVNRVKTLAMTIALRNFALPAAGTEVFKECWRHSLACAFSCEELAAVCERDKDDAYTAGLMHDIGRLAMLAASPEEYSQMVKEAREKQKDLLLAERDTFGMDHCLVGVRLLREWKFPAELCDAVQKHHMAPEGGRFGTTQLVHAGCQMADMLGFQMGGRTIDWSLEAVLAMIPSTARRDFQERADGLGLRILDKINSTECSLIF
jgi:putative nucleotidyltransferase with HDIG domain